MRLLAGLAGLIILFAILARMVPREMALPLYIVFVVLTIAFTGWERRRILRRRSDLERDLHKERLEPSRGARKERRDEDAA